jgi:REP element-mobilizing transposase RayT
VPKYDPQKHNRRSIRLRGYDYTLAGAYFVTICVENGRCLLGHINNDEMVLNQFGRSVNEEWQNTIRRRDHVELDEYVVMPNHFHAIVWLTNASELRATHASPLQTASSLASLTTQPDSSSPTRPKGPRPESLSVVIGSFKSAATRRINKIAGTAGTRFWQRNYYEHIVRNDRAVQAIRDYIICNPVNWDKDRLHPGNPQQSKWRP